MIDGLPTLSAGAHSPGEGKACVMEYVALLNGESWTDSPSCTHPVLAKMAQVVNDKLPDSRRHELVPLIGRLFGTAETGSEHERQVLSVQLAVWAGRQSLHLVRRADRAAREHALNTALAWTKGEATKDECAAYAANAAAYAAAYAANAPTLVGLLTGLIDEYDRLTGRTEHRDVTPVELCALSERVTTGA